MALQVPQAGQGGRGGPVRGTQRGPCPKGAPVPLENLSPLPANSVFRASTNFSRIRSFCRGGAGQDSEAATCQALGCVYGTSGGRPHFINRSCALSKVVQPQQQSQTLPVGHGLGVLKEA